jgi:tetratricopeptide (TPR) repeat protein
LAFVLHVGIRWDDRFRPDNANRYGEGFRRMRLVELFQPAINMPSSAAVRTILAVATVLVIAGFVLSFAKRVWFGRGLGLLGVCLAMAALYILREQTVTTQPTIGITVTRFRSTERVRKLLLGTMTLLPCASGVAMWFGLVKGRLRRRGQAPRHLKAGRRLFAQKDFEGALREYSLAIEFAPELAAAYCWRAKAYQETGQIPNALHDLDRAIARDPRYAAAYLERAKRRTEAGELDSALADFGQLMTIRANDPEAYLHRGVCLAKKGLFEEAAADFRRVLKLTNHSDYAEPAKNFIRHIESQAGMSALSAGNGAPGFSPFSTPPANPGSRV